MIGINTQRNQRMEQLVQNFNLTFGKADSPVTQWVEGNLTFIDKREVQAEYTVRKDVNSSFEKIHKGFLSLMQTEVAELMYFLISGLEESTVTNIQNHIIQQSNLGDKITVSAKCIHNHFSQEIETTIRDERGKIVAIGRVSFKSD